MSFRDFSGRVHALAEPLTELQFWTNPYGYGNSFGHLVLHLTGNLNYYIGTQIAGTGYVRDREREFTDTNPPAKAVALKNLDDAIAMVIRTFEAQTNESWSFPYEAKGAEVITNRFGILLRCTSHFHHHLGQMIYLNKEFTKAST